MHVEIQVALNFLISFLYNKLPRRRVNQFGEELENALKSKFEGHWYPEKPYKGSAYRCIRCAPPLDPLVFETAARNSGMSLLDIQDNLPQELSIWVDPGEVSYRISEKGVVKILFSETGDPKNANAEYMTGLNPEAQCFKPIEPLSNQFNGCISNGQFNVANTNVVPCVPSTPTQFNNSYAANKTNKPVTFTTASFAATKFGSTKLKTLGKKAQRSSPTEFNNNNLIKPKPVSQQHPHAKENYHKYRNYQPLLNNGNDDLFNIPAALKASDRINESIDIDGWKSHNISSFPRNNVWSELTAGHAYIGNNSAPNKLNLSANEGNSFLDHGTLLNYDFQESNKSTLLATNNGGHNKNSNQSNKFGIDLKEAQQFPFISDRLWDDILNMDADELTSGMVNSTISENVNIPNNNNSSNNVNINNVIRGNSLYSSSFSLSAISSPSLSSSNESSSNLINDQFDNLSLNSNSSSSIS